MNIAMKIVASISLATLLVCANGCVTHWAIGRASGHNTSSWVSVEKGDSVTQTNGVCTLVRVNPANKEETKIRFIRAPVSKFESCKESEAGGWLYKPNAAYYALLPLTVPTDIALSPFYAITYIMMLTGAIHE
jgi:hypothetical protein